MPSTTRGARPTAARSPEAGPDFKLLFEGAPGLFLVLKPDPQFTILGASDAYLRATLAERRNVVGRGLFEVFPDDPNDPHARGARDLRASLERVVESKRPDAMAVQKRDVRRPESEGGGSEERFLSPVNAPVLAPGGELEYIVHHIEDVTRFVRAGALAERQRETTERELERLTYSVSHDLRAPLRAIDGFSRILEEDYNERLDDEGRRLLSVVRDNSRKMSELIDQILEYSRLGRKPLSSADIDMGLVAVEALKDCEIGTPQPTLVLGALPPARGDLVLIRRVWLNLLSNAIKFSGKVEEPVIEVSGSEKAAEIVYCVKDNGVGFDMAYRDKLFGMFQRLHPESEFPGAGVGLAIVQRIVARHGGRVWAESKPNEGATVYFSLPKETVHG
jgi:signal transduction histidine kinase